MKRASERRRKRLVVPVALTIATLGAVATIGGALAGLAAGAGCGEEPPHADAGPDAPPDTPIV